MLNLQRSDGPDSSYFIRWEENKRCRCPRGAERHLELLLIRVLGCLSTVVLGALSLDIAADLGLWED